MPSTTAARSISPHNITTASMPHPATQRLPAGVTDGLWDYVNRTTISKDYDAYFAHNQLFQFDEQVVVRQLEAHDIDRESYVADLGCGTGRIVMPVARRGYKALAIDLSASMLAVASAKAVEAGLPIQCLRANLVDLACLTDNSCAAALCMFSTLGMIQGRENRHRCLRHMGRILQPGGLLVLHVHNYWYSLFDRGGVGWMLRNILGAILPGNVERGDKFFEYRGVPNMFLHIFRQGELRRALLRAGFCIQELIPLAPTRDRPLSWPMLAGSLRANGWIAVCDLPQTTRRDGAKGTSLKSAGTR